MYINSPGACIVAHRCAVEVPHLGCNRRPVVRCVDHCGRDDAAQVPNQHGGVWHVWIGRQPHPGASNDDTHTCLLLQDQSYVHRLLVPRAAATACPTRASCCARRWVVRRARHLRSPSLPQSSTTPTRHVQLCHLPSITHASPPGDQPVLPALYGAATGDGGGGDRSRKLHDTGGGAKVGVD